MVMKDSQIVIITWKLCHRLMNLIYDFNPTAFLAGGFVFFIKLLSVGELNRPYKLSAGVRANPRRKQV